MIIIKFGEVIPIRLALDENLATGRLDPEKLNEDEFVKKVIKSLISRLKLGLYPVILMHFGAIIKRQLKKNYEKKQEIKIKIIDTFNNISAIN